MKQLYIFFVVALIATCSFVASSASAVICNGVENGLNLCYPSFGGVELGSTTTSPLSSIVVWAYYGIIGISGLAAFLMILWGGLEWMTSSGNSSQITQAKERVRSALLGLLLVLSSYLILQIINPDLLDLREPQFEAPSPSTP